MDKKELKNKLLNSEKIIQIRNKYINDNLKFKLLIKIPEEIFINYEDCESDDAMLWIPNCYVIDKYNLKYKFSLSTNEPLFNLLSLYLNNYDFYNKEFENYFEEVILKELNKTLEYQFNDDYELQQELYNLYNNEFNNIIDEIIKTVINFKK